MRGRIPASQCLWQACRPSRSRAHPNAPGRACTRPLRTSLYTSLIYKGQLRQIATSPRLAEQPAASPPPPPPPPPKAPRPESSSPLLDPDRKWSTPLAKTLTEALLTTGPIPISSYMRQCLTFPDHGYYTSSTRLSDSSAGDQFGRKGDFITSPEISQMFGEMVGVWTVTEWIGQGRKADGVVLVEVGPGRGTLMDDILRTIRNFKACAKSIEAIYLVEAGPGLRDKQRRLLCGDDAAMEQIDIGFKSKDKYLGVPVVWVEDIRVLPQDPSKTPFIFAHEFFDALPIHAFQSVAPSPELIAQQQEQSQKSSDTIMTPSGPVKLTPEQQSQMVASLPKKTKTALTPQWRELVVSPNPKAVVTEEEAAESPQTEPDFQLTLARASTPHSLSLPEISARYQALKSTPGSVIEICPDGLVYAEDFARRIGGANKPTTSSSKKTVIQHPEKPNPSGAALILDYGPADTIPTSTLRGIRAHKLVSPLSAPGAVDISADVDFLALAEAAIRASPGVEVHGPVEQGDFLLSLGIQERAKELAKKMLTMSKEEGEEIKTKIAEMETGWKRLVERGGGGMGRIYKALVIVPENGGKRRPVGFGGSLMGQ